MLDSSLESILTMEPGGPNDALCDFLNDAIDEWNGMGDDVDNDGTPGDGMPPEWKNCLDSGACVDSEGKAPEGLRDPRTDDHPPCDC